MGRNGTLPDSRLQVKRKALFPFHRILNTQPIRFSACFFDLVLLAFSPMPHGTTPNRGHGCRPLLRRYERRGGFYRAGACRGRACCRTGRDRRLGHNPGPADPPSYGYLDFLDDLARGQRSDLALSILLGGLGLGLAVAGPILLAWGLSELVRATGRAFCRNRNRKALQNQKWIRRRLRQINRNLREPPTAEQLTTQWTASRTSLEGKLLLGAMMGDLESAVDNAYIRDASGEIVGRRPGIRGWLDVHCPALSGHYKTLMRYKALADKMKLFASSGSAEAAAPAGSLEAERQQQPEQEPEQEPEPVPDFVSDIAVRFHPNENQVRTMLKQHRTFVALDDALWFSLGLVRMGRRPRRRPMPAA